MLIRALQFSIIVLLGLSGVVLYNIIHEIAKTSESGICHVTSIKNNCPNIILYIQVNDIDYIKNIESEYCLSVVTKYTSNPEVKCYINSNDIYFESEIYVISYAIMFSILFVISLSLIIVYRWYNIESESESESESDGDPGITRPEPPEFFARYPSTTPQTTPPIVIPPPKYSTLIPKPPKEPPPSYSEFQRNARILYLP